MPSIRDRDKLEAPSPTSPQEGVGAARGGAAYWRSLDELADSPRFRALAGSEFAGYEPQEVIASPTRRAMMKLMGASMALAGVGGLSGCRRWPERKLAPYNDRPEDRIPGVPELYATAFELGGVAQPLLVTAYDGRPIKVEGNPEHPFSAGAASTLAQASILDLYDPERSKRVTRRSQKGNRVASGWTDVAGVLREAGGGEGLAILSEATSSPTIAALRKALKPARWFEYEPVSGDNETVGTRLAFGKPLRSHLHLDKAQVIACFDADVICGSHPASLKYARDFVKGRRGLDEHEPSMSRLYVAESTMTITGTNADRRLAIASSRIADVVFGLAAALGVADAGNGDFDNRTAKFVEDMAADLKQAKGRGVVVAGAGQPPEVHAAVAQINTALGAIGQTITYTAAVDQPTHVEAIRNLVSEMNAGTVKTLLILGGNPIYDAPADLQFDEALAKVPTSIHLSHHEDETSRVCTWHLPRSHYFEAWGDARAWDGSVSVVQPLIMPLYDTRSSIEVLAMVLGEQASGYDMVRRTFGEWIEDETFERGWRKALRNGLLAGSADEVVTPEIKSPPGSAAASSTRAPGEWELTFHSDYSVYDGRFANNGWLQELPDPVTKVVWDNAAMVSPVDAKRLGVEHGDVISVRSGELRFDLPVYVLPGQATGSIAVALGYGRTSVGYIGSGVGYNAYQVRTADAMHIAAIEEPRKLARSQKLVTTQDHYAIDQMGMNERQERVDRLLVRTAPLDYYQKHPDFAQHMDLHTAEKVNETGRKVPLQIFDEPVNYENVHRWGMAIDLSSCVGCNACVVACQAENNIPIVGKQEVSRNREMHWIRVDRYFTAVKDGHRVAPGSVDVADPELEFRSVHQPIPCMQCETAPCEQVCPVAATVHDSEGINVMIYNRCVGTRYCSNNCPYKVRRFNYFDWHSKPVHGSPLSGTFLGFPDQQQQMNVHPTRRMGFNPEVTVRMRGVMEKCTFCTQRIKAATIPALNAFRSGERQSPRVEDGTITPACAQTCPTDAIVFGDLNDPNSRVRKMFDHPRSYAMLKELNTRPRVQYLAMINNPGHGQGIEPPVEHHGAEAHEEKHG